MVGGGNALGMIEAGEGEIKRGRLGFAAKKQLRAAMAAEFAPLCAPDAKWVGLPWLYSKLSRATVAQACTGAPAECWHRRQWQ